ncbi:hypothetical protein AM1_0900 [Acaryochloris marina MBIC11017]|uniref:Uncharacterized protein n=1 Tax=Acaryochloris marina (strain MBIC 11017) TaxID=329726 RepID=B0BZL5_ACAM1|nr:hypothetical protein AM1_0900 [Acaryochloris marina MBIC11017]
MMVSIKSAQAIYHMTQQSPTPQNLKIFMTQSLIVEEGFRRNRLA